MKKIVYILGSTRTGSTMLDLIISSNSECVSLGDLCLSYRRECALCGESCEPWKAYKKRLIPPYYYKTAFEVFEKDIIVDSSKRWLWLNERIHEEPEYDYKVIHLVRNGKDRLLTKKRRYGKITASMVEEWIYIVEKSEELRKKYGGILIHYEDICREESIRSCCDFIGINYGPQMLDFWRIKHHGIPGSEKTYSLVKEYHGIPHNHKDFVKRVGFKIKCRTGHEFLDQEDLDTFHHASGNALNEKLGYSS